MIYFGHNVTIIFWQQYEILWEESKKLLPTLRLAFLCLSSSRDVIYGSNNERWTSVWFQLSTNFWQTRSLHCGATDLVKLYTEGSTVECLLANLICKTTCWDRYNHGTKTKMKWLPTVFDGTREAKFQINIIKLRTSSFLWPKSFFSLYHKWIFWHTSSKNSYLAKKIIYIHYSILYNTVWKIIYVCTFFLGTLFYILCWLVLMKLLVSKCDTINLFTQTTKRRPDEIPFFYYPENILKYFFFFFFNESYLNLSS